MSDDERAVFSRAQVRHYDQVAIQHCSVPSLILMENAGRGATDALLPYVRGQDDQVVVACGRGNNGGDGFVVARHLLAQGYANITCWVLAPLEKVSGDARKNLDAWLGLGGRTQFIEKDLTPFRSALAEADVVVDALLGTGLDRPVEGRVRATIEAINDAPADVFSLDIPSGLDADTGQTLGASVTAQATATFARLKAGLLQGDAIAQAGDLRVISLGIPDRQVVEAVGTTAELVALDTVDRALGQRRIDVHKYGAGAVLLAAGRVGSIGAAELTARGAYRAGAGLVTIATWADAAPRLEGCLPEAMVLGLPSTSTRAALTSALERRRAAGVGPGFGVDTKAQSVVEHLALAWDRPVVLDADAITCFAGRSEALVTAPAARILTPHAG
ncbi:MAG: NAD(P)H-hydrate epimerase, partial [Myxococcota bacterium]